MKKWIAIFTVLPNILYFSLVWAGDTPNASTTAQSNLINGVSKFLVERADDNFLYILQTKMKKNPAFEKYMPETFKYVKSNNLFILLKDKGNGILKESLTLDIRNFPKNVLLNEIESRDLTGLLTQLKYSAMENGTYILYTMEITAAIKEIADSLHLLETAFSDLKKGDEPGDESFDRFILETAAFNQKLKTLGNLLIGEQHCNDECRKKVANLYEFVAKAKKYAKFSAFLLAIYNVSKNNTEHVKTLYKIDMTFQDYINKEDSILEFTYKDVQAYNQFMKYVTVFALISEPSSEDDVTAILKNLAMPPVSFFVKREPHAKKAMITAYFGLQSGYERHTGAYGGMSVPLGMELTKSFSSRHQWGAVSVLFAPVDFAHPVNKIMDSSKSTMRWEDIFVPGVYLSYAIKDYPIVVGVGASYGASLNEANASKEWRGMFFVGMDMPLYNLYR